MIDYPGLIKCMESSDGLECYFKKGRVLTFQINEFCFNKGIVLSQLTAKKKRLEEKFFELTGD